jgi:hypothetical protein
MGFTGSEENFALGYLAKNGTITAQIPQSQRAWFEDLYKRLCKLWGF